jgi:microcystin-dependent protein
MDSFLGEIRMFAGNYAPAGWEFCFGQLLNITGGNEALFSLLGTRFGGDGRTNFGLPDMRGRVPIHYGLGPGLTNRMMGQRFGTETETLDETQIPQHQHQIMANNAPASNQNSPATAVLSKSPADFQNFTPDMSTPVSLNATALNTSGNGEPHTNVMPGQVLNFIICVQGGLYPPRNDQ